MLKRSHTYIAFLSSAFVVSTLAAMGLSAVSARDNSMPVGHVQLKNFATKQHSKGVYLQSESTSGTQVHFSIPEGQDTATYVTEQFTPDFSFNALAVKWEGSVADESNDTEFTLFVRNHSGDIQRRILSPIEDDVKGPLPANTYVSQPIMVEDVESFWITVGLTRNAQDHSSPLVDDIDFTYIDSSRPIADEPEPLIGVQAAEAADTVSDELGIVSRAEWGADESLRKDADGNEIWEQQFADPEVFIVHHTAGTDGGDDPAATIRAIYYYHAVVLGWGDIGYNYLIDPNGVIYHGRKGGDGVVGGHTYNSVDDVGFNDGSVGIAVLGCFEETEGACYTQYPVTDATKAALAQLIGTKSAEFGIDPSDEVTFQGRDIHRVIGHRDVDYTYCPGSAMEADITDIRSASHDVYLEQLARLYEGSFASDTSVSVNRSNPDQITIQYTNTGLDTWTQDALYLKIYRKSGKKPTALRDSSWPDVLGKIRMQETSVEPGDTATFIFSIRVPEDADSRTVLTKLFSKKTKVKKTNTKVHFSFADTATDTNQTSDASEPAQ